MTEIFRVRIERELLRQAAEVCEEIGTTPTEVTRIMFKQLVTRREIPFPLLADAPETQELAPLSYRARLAEQL